METYFRKESETYKQYTLKKPICKSRTLGLYPTSDTAPFSSEVHDAHPDICFYTLCSKWDSLLKGYLATVFPFMHHSNHIYMLPHIIARVS